MANGSERTGRNGDRVAYRENTEERHGGLRARGEPRGDGGETLMTGAVDVEETTSGRPRDREKEKGRETKSGETAKHEDAKLKRERDETREGGEACNESEKRRLSNGLAKVEKVRATEEAVSECGSNG